tara:strand:- start:2708 stop:3472 length:765 start_codon:yes stop_codon:yes gene_type:complete
MIKTFDNKEWQREDILKRMYDDEFYYGYLGSNALSSSSAKKLIQSPKAYLKSLKINSDAQPLRDGRLVHLSVLEPHKVKDLTIIDGSKATKAFKQAVLELGSANVYTRSEFNNANYIAESVLKCNEVTNLLKGAEFEVPEIAMIDGLPFRGKADVLNGNVVIDLKTTGDITRFKWSAKNFSYDLQAALYMKMFNADAFIFVVVDKDTKDIMICDCSDEFIRTGLRKLDTAIEQYKYFFQDEVPNLNNYITHETL